MTAVSINLRERKILLGGVLKSHFISRKHGVILVLLLKSILLKNSGPVRALIVVTVQVRRVAFLNHPFYEVRKRTL